MPPLVSPLLGTFYSYGQPVGYLVALLAVSFGLFGLLGHPAGYFRPLRFAVLIIFASGVASSLVFVFAESSVLRGCLCLVAAAIAITIFQLWWTQLLNNDPDTTRLYVYVVAVVCGVAGLYVDLASIA